MIRHIPNMLSGLRLLAAPLAAWLILNDHDTAALIVFAVAGASDGLDGHVARRWGFTSRFGAWLDPVADKLLMLFCMRWVPRRYGFWRWWWRAMLPSQRAGC